MLKCENPNFNSRDFIDEFKDSDEGISHEGPFSADFEHDQWFITCISCGAQWSVNDAEGRDGEYYQFDEITDGDDSCLNHSTD